MTTKQLDSGSKAPITRVRSGRFQISTWMFVRTVKSGNTHSVSYTERRVETQRVCIQHSVKDRLSGGFRNQSIWCSPDDLRSLAEAVEKLNEVEPIPPDDGEGGWLSPEGRRESHGEVEKMNRLNLNRIVEYVKLMGFRHDEDEVEEDLHGVLGAYGIWETFSSAEERELKTELKLLAIEQELAEVSFLVARQEAVKL